MAATPAPVPETKGEGLSGQDLEQRFSSMDETRATQPCSFLFPTGQPPSGLVNLLFPHTCLRLSSGCSWYECVQLAQAVTAVTVAGNRGIVPSPPSALHPGGHMEASECSLDSNELADLDGCFPLSISGLV